MATIADLDARVKKLEKAADKKADHEHVAPGHSPAGEAMTGSVKKPEVKKPD